MKLISIIGLFCMIFFAVGFDFGIFLDIPSISMVILGTIFLTGISYKKGIDKIEVMTMIRRNSIIMGIIISFLSIFLFLIKKSSNSDFDTSVYIAISILPCFYGGVISLIADVFLREKNNNLDLIEVKESVLKKEHKPTESSIRDKYTNLTERENEILILIREGMSNREIAGRAYISENTVKKHVGSIFAKLDVKNRIELINKLNQG